MGRYPSIPQAPSVCAISTYTGAHAFVGRQAELATLNEWAGKDSDTPVLLVDAIGGNGKSMLAWEWLTACAADCRDDWAGRFWYSFHEQGTVMVDFCRNLLAYVSGEPREAMEKLQTREMHGALLNHLQARPWLLVLDGLERILVAYHRIDAAELPDEAADSSSDVIGNRQAIDAVREEDHDFLRALVKASPSKILITSRLTPSALANAKGLPVPNVKRMSLPGLTPADAEALIRQGGVSGDGPALRRFLGTHCDNQPLTVGLLAGLIVTHPQARGSFDEWRTEPENVRAFSNDCPDLIRWRNHILTAAIQSVPGPGRQLLSTLALVNGPVDRGFIEAMNPHLPKHRRMRDALRAWTSLGKHRNVGSRLNETLADLKRRGLLTEHGRLGICALHPAVRSAAAANTEKAELKNYGRHLLDHFTARCTQTFESAKSVEDLTDALHITRLLIKLGRLEAAADWITDRLGAPLLAVEGYAEFLSLLRPFFPQGWGIRPAGLDDPTAMSLLHYAGITLLVFGETDSSIEALSAAIEGASKLGDHNFIFQPLYHIALSSWNNSPARAMRVAHLGLEIAHSLDDPEIAGLQCLELCMFYHEMGLPSEAVHFSNAVKALKTQGETVLYRKGAAEWVNAMCLFWQSNLTEDILSQAESAAEQGKNRQALRGIAALRGAWCLEKRLYAEARQHFSAALMVTNGNGIENAVAKTGLALASVHLGQMTVDEAHREAEWLAQLRRPAHYYLGQLWQFLGEIDQARLHSVKAYEQAWADGEPYVHRYELTKATALLNELGVPTPQLPPYDPTKDEALPWEHTVHAAIEKLRCLQEARRPLGDEGSVC